MDHGRVWLSTHSAMGRTRSVMLRPCTLQDPAAAAGGVLERAACYGPAELRMGASVSVYGRDFLIVDCDDFTRKWLLVRRRNTLAGARRSHGSSWQPMRRTRGTLFVTALEAFCKVYAPYDTALVSIPTIRRPMTVLGDMQESQGCSAAEAAPVDMAERIPQPVPRPLPPYNGFGSLEDSAQSCRSLIPQVATARDPESAFCRDTGW